MKCSRARSPIRTKRWKAAEKGFPASCKDRLSKLEWVVALSAPRLGKCNHTSDTSRKGIGLPVAMERKVALAGDIQESFKARRKRIVAGFEYWEQWSREKKCGL